MGLFDHPLTVAVELPRERRTARERPHVLFVREVTEVYFQAQNPIMHVALMDALLGALSTVPTAALLTTPKVHLYTNQMQPTAESLITDFTEATFAGYGPILLPSLLGPVKLNSDQQALITSLTFIGGAIVSPGQNVWGYFVADTTGAILYWAEPFPAPMPFANVGDFLSLTLLACEPASRPCT